VIQAKGLMKKPASGSVLMKPDLGYREAGSDRQKLTHLRVEHAQNIMIRLTVFASVMGCL